MSFSIEFSLSKYYEYDGISLRIGKEKDECSLKDPRLGKRGPLALCETCQNRYECLGHIGLIAIDKPTFKFYLLNTNFVKLILKLICPVCTMISNIKFYDIFMEIIKNGNISKEIKENFRNILAQEIKRKRTKCENTFCTSSISSISYNSKKGFFHYKSNNEQIILGNEKIFKIFQSIPSLLIKLILEKDYIFDIRDLFFVKGIPVPSPNARIESIYSRYVSEPLTTVYAKIIDSKNNETSLNQKINACVTTSTHNYEKTHQISPISRMTISNKKDSLMRSEIIGKKIAFTGRVTASAKMDGSLCDVELTNLLASKVLVAVFYNDFTKKEILEGLKKSLYLYLVRRQLWTDGKNIITYLQNIETSIFPKRGDILFRPLKTGDLTLIRRPPTFSAYSTLAYKAIVME